MTERYLTNKIESECLPVEFSVEGDELTPTKQIKRNVVNKKYAKQIASLFAKPRDEKKGAAALA